MRSHFSSAASLTASCLCIVFLFTSPAGAQEAPLRFRKVFVPQGDIEALKRDYMPIGRDKFKRLLAEIQSQSATPNQLAARIQRAEYSAVLDGDQLINGQAKLDVVHHSTDLSLLPLAPCNLALGPATWQGDEEGERAASLGIDSQGILVAIVERSDTLQLPWTAHGTVNQLREIAFDLALAPSGLSRIQLELPTNLTPTVNRGVVSLIADNESPEGIEGESGRRAGNTWSIELGGATRVRLVLKPYESQRRRDQLVMAREDTLYEMTNSGLDLRTTLQLDVYHEPLTRLNVAVPRELHIVAARVAGIETDWSVASISVGGMKQLQIPLTSPLLGLGQSIEIEAIGPLQTNAPWKLPRLRPEAVFWQEGRVTLEVPQDLRLAQLIADQARQSGIGTTDNAGESHRFQLYSAAGSLQVILRRRQPEISVAVGTTIDLDPDTLTAQTIADFRAQYGQRFVLEADMPKAWSIDGIESTVADTIDDYQVFPVSADMQRLQIRLRSSLSSEQPLRLKIRTHRAESFLLQEEHFRPIQFRDVRRVAQVVAVAPDPSYRLDVTGDAGVTFLSPDDLRRASDDRVQPRPGGMVFADDPGADSLAIAITQEAPSFSARILVEADGKNELLEETYRIECVPESTPISRLFIHMSEPRDARAVWQLVDQPDGILRQEPLIEEEKEEARLNVESEIWEIVLRSPQSDPFVLQGTRSTPFHEKLSVSLATLPAAAVQDGWLRILSSDGSQLTIDAQSVKAIPRESCPPNQFTTSRARFRYDPSRKASVVLAHLRPQVGQTNTWAWNGRLTSQFEANGRAVHRAEYLLENSGEAQIGIRIPTGCSPLGIDVDGTAVSDLQMLDLAGFITVPLPEGRRFPHVEVTYTSAGEGLGIWGSASIEFPELSVPVLSRRWTVWLPPGYRATNDNRNAWPRHENNYTWKQRIFGALAALPEQQPFRLFSAKDWSSLFGREKDEDPSTLNAQLTLQILGEQLIDLHAASDEQLPVTWRRLLVAYQHRVNASAARYPSTVWVDQAQLSEAGFSLDAVVTHAVANSPVESAVSALTQANLAIVAADDSLLLTGTDGLSRYAPSPETLENRAVALAKGRKPLSRQLHRSSSDLATGLVPLSSWIAQPAAPSSPWNQQGRSRTMGLMNAQWRMYDVSLGATELCHLHVEQTTTLRAIGWTGMLIVAGVGAWLGLRKPRYLLVIIVVAAAVALIVPDGLVPITSNLMLGTLLATVLVAVNSVPASLRMGRPTPAASPTVAVTATVLLLLTYLLAGSHLVLADETAGEANESRLLVPVDDELNPVGDYLYLPLDFYDELHRRARRGGDKGGEWIIQSANYRAVYAWHHQRTALDMTDLIAVYQIEVTRAQQQVTIEWPNGAARSVILEARLAGQPAELMWNDTDTAFSVVVPQSGTSQLELVIRPETQSDSTHHFVKLPVPANHRARVRVESPMDATGIEVVSRLGATHLDPDNGDQVVELGPATGLHITWPLAANSASTTNQIEVSELKWLRVRPPEQPNSVVIDARYRFRAIAGQIDEIRLVADPRLRLRPLGRDQLKLLHEPVIQDDDSQVITWKLREPTQGEITLDVQFWMTKTSGLGKLPLPGLEPGTGRVSRRWLAVSVSPDLEYTPSIDELLDPLDAAEFLTAWGDTATVPALTYRCLTADPVWSLATRARTPRTETRQQLNVSVGLGSIDLVLQAQLSTVDGEVFQHRLSVPPGFDIQSAVLISDDADIAARVDSDDLGNVTVFLNRGVSGEQRLELRGRVSVAANQFEIPFPRVTLLDTDLLSDEIRLFRQSEVSLQVQASPPLPSTVRPAIGSFYDPFGRLVAAINLSAADASRVGDAILAVEPNLPVTTATLETTLRRFDDQWEAVADLSVAITGDTGVIDKLRIAIPSEWAGPFTLDPPLEHQVRRIPDQRNIRHLIIRCPQPVANDGLNIVIRGPLDLSSSDSFHSLDIMPLDLQNVDRFLVLPTQLDQQRIEWETSGLQPATVDETRSPAETANTSVTKYQIYAKPRAFIADVQRVAGEKQISLADVYVACAPDGRYHGLVNFDIEPAGSSSCTLEMPEDVELLRATIEGSPVTLIPLAGRSWHIRLGPEQLPQRLTVVFRGQLSEQHGRQPLDIPVPQVTDLDTVRTLWTVRGPAGVEIAAGQIGEHRATAIRQEMLRLSNTASLVESASEIIFDSPTDEVNGWYSPWATRMAVSDARLSNLGWFPAAAEQFDPAAIDAIRMQQEGVATRLKTTVILEDVRAQTASRPQDQDVWTIGQHPGSDVAHFSFIGGVGHIPVAFPADTGPPRWPRWLAAMAVLAVGWSVYSLLRRGYLSSKVVEWPYALGVLAGLAWWLWCSPSILGWALVVVCLVGALRPPAHCHPLPTTIGPNSLSPSPRSRRHS